MKTIAIKGAREGNLKNLSVEIPREKLVVLTGVSGSGKSTLARDVLFQECQRQYLEAIGMQGIRKPDVESVTGVSPAVTISPVGFQKNPRSTVGTVTDIYTELRMIYEKLGKRTCPYCGKEIYASRCREETEKRGEDFLVHMYCSHCGLRMRKLTRTDFSYNTREGACQSCQGLGKKMSLCLDRVLHEEFSPEEGAVDFWEHRYGEYQTKILYQAFAHYGVPVKPGTQLKDYSREQKAILLYGTGSEEVRQLMPKVQAPKTAALGKTEGVCTSLYRKLGEKKGNLGKREKYFREEVCPQCGGERLQEQSRLVMIMDTRLPQLSVLSLEELYQWLVRLGKSMDQEETLLAQSYVLDAKTKVDRLLRVGLGYLSLDRQTMTLSGGEAQRMKLSAALDSKLTGILYFMDEPTIGLHPQDTAGLVAVLEELRDLGNTVVVIEHDPDVMQAADYMIDIGPGSGRHGGEVIGQGTLEELMTQESSVTGQYLKAPARAKDTYRKGTGKNFRIAHGNLFNLQDVSVGFPAGCLISVTGVSGSGKSTLIFELLGKAAKGSTVEGLEMFQRVVTVEQRPLSRVKRSNVATYSGVYGEIRRIFGSLPQAVKLGLDAGHFSFNSKGGRCENCQGLGVVISNLLFFEDVEVPCPVCRGRQFLPEVLSVSYKGYSISDVLHSTIEDMSEAFSGFPKIRKVLELLMDVGLGYLELGQTVTTLSQGEGQRLKLARELLENEGRQNLYLLDEPTTGLHPLDVENFLRLLQRMVDKGNTVVVVEHNLQVIRDSDWVIDLGPGGGIHGGRIVAQGTPGMLRTDRDSVTGKYL